MNEDEPFSMKTTLLSFLSIFIFSLSLAQIGIDSEDFTAMFELGNQSTAYYGDQSIIVDIGMPGGGNTFDFSNLNWDETYEIVSVDVSNTPYLDLFPDANICLQRSGENVNQYLYSEITNQSLGSLGWAGTIFDSEISQIFSPALIEASLPLSFESTWQTVSELNTSSDGDEPFSEIVEDLVLVDAYGTIIFPDGNSEEALRLRVESTYNEGDVYVVYTYLTVSGSLIEFQLTDSEYSNSGEVSVDFFTYQSSLILSSTDTQFPEGYGLEPNYPNPFISETKLDFNLPFNSDLKIIIRDVTGRIVEEIDLVDQAPGQQTFRLETIDWSSGIYIATLETEQYYNSIRLIKSSN